MYPEKSSSFIYYQKDSKDRTKISYIKNDGALKVSLEGFRIAHILRIHSIVAPKEITLDGQKLDASSWSFDEKKNKLIIRTNMDYNIGTYSIRF